jgi:hypothetical protein
VNHQHLIPGPPHLILLRLLRHCYADQAQYGQKHYKRSRMGMAHQQPYATSYWHTSTLSCPTVRHGKPSTDNQILCECQPLPSHPTAEMVDDQFCHEMGRLLQGYIYANTKGTETGKLSFTMISQRPRKTYITYCRVVVTDRPRLSRTPPRTHHCWRIASTTGDVSTKTSDLTQPMPHEQRRLTPGPNLWASI